MPGMVPFAAVLVATWLPFAPAQSDADEPIVPLIELQSEALTPGLVLDECPRRIHQVRIVVDAKLERGTLILDPNVPEFDEFGELTGGILTPQARGQAGPLKAVELACEIEAGAGGRRRVASVPAEWFEDPNGAGGGGARIDRGRWAGAAGRVWVGEGGDGCG